ncbi:putative histidine kinase group protein [Sordaria brevicollis]|uniref:Histidine kinase group protein n=1 Tax=Sordaria brevicollis TaxID=83679 RepID=A0AAE0PCM8_SORBR|nr:putative histidine kinase group protein [Sordaria brevicollis]
MTLQDTTKSRTSAEDVTNPGADLSEAPAFGITATGSRDTHQSSTSVPTASGRSFPVSHLNYIQTKDWITAHHLSGLTAGTRDGRFSGVRAPSSGRYGPIASKAPHEHLGALSIPPISGHFGHPQPLATPPIEVGPGGTQLTLGKRITAEDKPELRPLDSPSKKPRLVAPGSLRLPPLPQTPAELVPNLHGVSSPLFFSNRTKHHHPTPRMHSFFSNGIAASIMSSVQETQDGVTTLRLPKGHVTTTTAQGSNRSSSTPGSWTSSESLDATMRSPDGRPLAIVAPALQAIPATELLDQDPRPVFIVDLGNPLNISSGLLHIVYANPSLKASTSVLELLNGDTADTEADSFDFAHFKHWVANPEANSESVDLAPTSITFGGIHWTCATLRKRFRVITGHSNIVSHTPTTPSPVAQMPPILSRSSRGSVSARELSPERGDVVDYFGPVEEAGSPRPRSYSEPRSPSRTIIDTSLAGLNELPMVLPLSQVYTTFDWTRIPADDPNLGPHHRFARSIDWASTPLGPVEEWPADLRIMSNMIMGSPHPAALYWGEEFVAIYNEAYIALAGKKHPQLMGARYKDAWAEIWDEIAPVFDAAWNEGSAMMKHDDGLFITRHGFLEETFFNWAIIPLVGGDGTVVALYNPAFENTRRKINERRMLTLREVGVKTSQARDVKGFWSMLQQGLEYNGLDVPFALIYSVAEENESEVASINSGSVTNPPQITLEGAVGVPEGHPSAVKSIDLRTSDEGFAPYMRESMAHPNNPIILSENDGTLPQELIEGFEWRGFGDPCRTIVVFPVHPTTAGDMVVGFIVLGVNPRRQYDEDYQLFVNLLSRQLATSMASVVLFEEEIKRGQRAARLAALDRQQLSMQLHLRTQEAVESEYRFARMAELGPVGLFIADSHGRINYCNEMWWRILGHERSASTLDAWMQSIRDEDREGVMNIWRHLVEEKVPVTYEFRFNGTRKIVDGHTVDTWALMSAYPERDETGELKSIFGCITDISQQKWAEDFQKRRRDEAVELKRQQENFIDITSHEMRNPLSAILQCADEIASGLNKYRQEDPAYRAPDTLETLVDSCLEAANTISLCASHQKRIVDDILTLSKLDSQLLLVTPVDVQPVQVVEEVLKMFEAELNSNDIKGHFQIEESYRNLEINWVKLDPSRLKQVLINLMTNAIKFTQGRPTRAITINLGASKDVSSAGLSYFPPRHPDQEDLTDDAEWATGEKINLHLAVSDTGPGLDENEKKILFQRFSQTSPRTHVQYGGSGLGLFICRILTELQGGQIGVYSEKGEGSTFAFYIKSRKAENPQPVATVVDNSMSIQPFQQRVSPSTQGQISHRSTGSAAFSLLGHGRSHPPPTRTQSAPALTDVTQTRSLDVLIVEDNLVNQKVLQRQLQLSGNNTFVANHGGEALVELSKSRFWNQEVAATDDAASALPKSNKKAASTGGTDGAPDGAENNKNISVILMDLEMPVMDGMSCTREIRRLEDAGVITRHIPIIAVTAYARPEQVESARAAGVDDVISKPFRLPELIPKIEELVLKYDGEP